MKIRNIGGAEIMNEQSKKNDFQSATCSQKGKKIEKKKGFLFFVERASSKKKKKRKGQAKARKDARVFVFFI